MRPQGEDESEIRPDADGCGSLPGPGLSWPGLLAKVGRSLKVSPPVVALSPETSAELQFTPP